VLLLQIIFNYFLDYAVIGTKPLWNELMGGLLIVGSNFAISFLRLFNLIQ